MNNYGNRRNNYYARKTREYETEDKQEGANSPFLLPSSINAPPSPSICRAPLPLPLPPRSMVGARPFDSAQNAQNAQDMYQQMHRFRLSAAPEPFTPAKIRPITPAVPDAVASLQRELMDSVRQVDFLTENLRSCQNSLKLRMGENLKLRKYINTLHNVIGEPTCPPDDYFSGEFGMLWRSIHNFGKCFYKFPTDTSIPSGLGDVMQGVLGDKETVYRVVGDKRTKLLAVAGILARFLAADVFNGRFFEELFRGDSILKGGESGMHALRGYYSG